MFVKVKENNENLIHAFTERNALCTFATRSATGKPDWPPPPTLRNLICTLLKHSGHVNEIEAIMHFLVHEDQPNIVLLLKAKLLRKEKISVILGSTFLSRPLRLLISWLGSSFVSKYWVFCFGLELLHILYARHKWPFGQDICNIIWKRGNLSYFF